jgi:mono/diheme cytochrome c family protein
MIYCTYPGADATVCAQAFCLDPNNPADCDGMGSAVPVEPATAGKNGRWSGDFAREMAEGWYDDDPDTDAGGDGLPDFDRATFNGEYVPAGWDPANVADQSRAGADALFLDVVQPICFVCHSRRGTNLGTDQSPGVSKDIDFSTYERFIGHASQIKTYVFDRGVMPLSLRGYNAFWGDPERPRLLALHINAALTKQGAAAEDLVQFNADNVVDQPGAVVADAGPARTTASPVRLFASNTRFADSYAWQVISTPVGGEAASLSDATTSRPVFSAPIDGDYVVQLTASNEKGDSDSDIVNIKIDSGVTPAPADIVFSDITTVMETIGGNTDAKACASCHQVVGGGGDIPGVPVFWTATPADAGVSRYQEALARIDFNDPENSLILLKPSGNHHYGGLREGFDVNNPADRFNYDLFLNWIMEGARFDANNMREP